MIAGKEKSYNKTGSGRNSPGLVFCAGLDMPVKERASRATVHGLRLFLYRQELSFARAEAGRNAFTAYSGAEQLQARAEQGLK